MLGAVLVHDARDRLEPLLFGQLVLVVFELLLAAAFALDRVVGIVAVVEIAVQSWISITRSQHWSMNQRSWEMIMTVPR